MPITGLHNDETENVSGRRIRLEFANHTAAAFDIVVLAIPAPTLRDVKIEPGLIPDNQIKAIQKITYGQASKILMPVRLQEKGIAYQRTADGTLLWMNGTKSIITLYTAGRQSLYDASSQKSLTAEFAKEKEAIERVLPGATFPAGTEVTLPADAFSPACTQAVGINWTQERYSQGCYSTIARGQDDLMLPETTVHGEKVRTTFCPVGKRLIFAGEHTDLDNQGTMEGAVASGMQVARLVQKMNVVA